MDRRGDSKSRTDRRAPSRHGGAHQARGSHRGAVATHRKKTAPTRRVAGARVQVGAVRALRSGHPWVFRDALLRPLSNVEDGALVPVSDHEGYHLGWGMYDAKGTVALRMVSRANEMTWDQAHIDRTLDRALERRSRQLDEGCARSRRLIHAEADGFPGLAADLLGEHVLLYKYARSADHYLEAVASGIMERGLCRGIYLQDRVRPVQPGDRRPPAALIKGAAAAPEFEVEEDGLKFIVDISAPVSPGLFLDLREGRRWFEPKVKGKRVLNLFSFTGAFGLRAVRGGASEVVNVDSAARSHARCRQNLVASGFDAEACVGLQGEAFHHLERLERKERLFDLIVVDPPPFSRVDGSVFSALKDWSRLMRAVLRVAAPGAEIMTVCNAASLSGQEFLNAIGEGLAWADRSGSLLGERGLPPDFPVLPAFGEGRYLKVKLIAVD